MSKLKQFANAIRAHDKAASGRDITDRLAQHVQTLLAAPSAAAWLPAATIKRMQDDVRAAEAWK